MENAVQEQLLMVENLPADSWIFRISFILTLVWILGVTILFIIMLRKYTFGKWTETHKNPYALETLGMPRGFFRGILTISLLFMVMLLEVLNLNMRGLETKINQLLVAFQMMLAFYFGSKVMHHVTKADERKSERLSDVLAVTRRQAAKTDDFEVPGAVG